MKGLKVFQGFYKLLLHTKHSVFYKNLPNFHTNLFLVRTLIFKQKYIFCEEKFFITLHYKGR